MWIQFTVAVAVTSIMVYGVDRVDDPVKACFLSALVTILLIVGLTAS